ncbi:MAG: DUF5069 domain-containing protein [Candidatus Eremiobacteraeota bacterium]|nr:DUF5069 domain-containing protein [Candidatus Eremiobacteraeota bacterium]
MRPVSLRRRPPRDPRARLAGLMLLPRTIDKARGLMRGGDPGEYVISPGISAWLLAECGFSEAEFIELVRRALDEAEIAAAVAARVSSERREALNAVIKSLRVADLPPEHRERFARLHGAQDDELVLDVLVADDRCALRSTG